MKSQTFTNKEFPLVTRHLIVVLTAFFNVMPPGVVASAAERLNLLILFDDLADAEVDSHGSLDITTPPLEQLANNDTIFTSTHVAHPFCRSSRIGMMAGRSSHASGVPFQLPNNGYRTEKFGQRGIRGTEAFPSTVLRDPGCRTGANGAWEPNLHFIRTTMA